MKQNILLVLFFLTVISYGQTCAVGNVVFTDQASVDSFVSLNSGNCDTIDGSLIVVGTVTDLSGLSFLTSISGDITMSGATLNSLAGLQNITSINKLRLTNMLSLTDISALNFQVSDIELRGLNISNLGGLTFAANMEEIDIRDLLLLNSISSFSTINYVNFEIHLDNLGISNLIGLENLTSVVGGFFIEDNLNLNDISSLSSLAYSQGLFVNGNTSLDECCVINRVFANELSLGGPLSIMNNSTNCMNVGSILTLCTPILADGDDDRIADSTDNCPDMNNETQTDTDDDSVGDICDNCPDVANTNQLDTNGDGIGDLCQTASGGFGAGTTGGVGINTTEPHSLLEVADGDIFINNINRGVIMKTASGKCFRYQPSDSGVLQAKEITCPDN